MPAVHPQCCSGCHWKLPIELCKSGYWVPPSYSLSCAESVLPVRKFWNFGKKASAHAAHASVPTKRRWKSGLFAIIYTRSCLHLCCFARSNLCTTCGMTEDSERILGTWRDYDAQRHALKTGLCIPSYRLLTLSNPLVSWYSLETQMSSMKDHIKFVRSSKLTAGLWTSDQITCGGKHYFFFSNAKSSHRNCGRRPLSWYLGVINFCFSEIIFLRSVFLLVSLSFLDFVIRLFFLFLHVVVSHYEAVYTRRCFSFFSLLFFPKINPPPLPFSLWLTFGFCEF